MKKIVLLLMVGMFGLAAQANAAVTVYASYYDDAKSDWVSAVGNYTTEDFSDSIWNTEISSVSGTGYLVHDHYFDGDPNNGYWQDGAMLDMDGILPAITTFSFSSAITAFGADWSMYHDDIWDGDIQITLGLVGGGTDVLNIIHNAGVFNGSGFLGFISDVAFTYVTISSNDMRFALDNVVYSTASPVPVPAAVWLFGSGLLGLLGIRRKKA